MSGDMMMFRKEFEEQDGFSVLRIMRIIATVCDSEEGNPLDVEAVLAVEMSVYPPNKEEERTSLRIKVKNRENLEELGVLLIRAAHQMRLYQGNDKQLDMMKLLAESIDD
jgi:hypothetical protein